MKPSLGLIALPLLLAASDAAARVVPDVDTPDRETAAREWSREAARAAAARGAAERLAAFLLEQAVARGEEAKLAAVVDEIRTCSIIVRERPDRYEVQLRNTQRRVPGVEVWTPQAIELPFFSDALKARDLALLRIKGQPWLDIAEAPGAPGLDPAIECEPTVTALKRKLKARAAVEKVRAIPRGPKF